MGTLLITLLTLGGLIQVPEAPLAAPFAGTWTSTAAPQARLGPTSFDVVVRDGKTLLTFERRPAGEPTVYGVFAEPRTKGIFEEPPVRSAGRLTLLLTQQTANGTQLYLVRFLDAGRAEVEWFMASSDPAKPGGHVPLGIYAKGK